MLDVIEHVEDDGGFVRSIVEDCLEPEKGLVVVSVPAWPVLFTRHDELLLHHRRYVPKACDEVLEAAGLELVERGGAFHSLLLPRVLEVFRDRIERVVGRSDRSVRSAAATWGGGAMVTAAVEALLRADSAVSKLASQCGANVPGLSYWALARKRRRS
jgi:hypothetical protein